MAAPRMRVPGHLFRHHTHLAPAMAAAVMALTNTVVEAAAIPTHQLRDLGTLGGIWADDLALNDLGQLTGSSQTASGTMHAFLYADGTMTDLGDLCGSDNWSAGTSINEAGQVAGSSSDCSGHGHAFLYQSGVMTDVGTFGGYNSRESRASALNNNGQVAGWSQTATGRTHAFLYSDGALIDLGPGFGDATMYPNYEYSEPYAINDAGQVVGGAQYDNNSHAFIYENGVMTDLGTLGGQRSVAQDINASGWVTGFAQPAGPPGTRVHSFAWRPGSVMTDLGTLPLGSDPQSRFSVGQFINNRGQVAGYSGDGSNYHAFLYTDGELIDLGTLGGGHFSYPNALNDTGEVIGRATIEDNVYGPFLFSHGQMRNLNDLVLAPEYLITSAQDINNRGQIAALARIEVPASPYGSEVHAVLLTPIGFLLNGLIEDVSGIGPGKALANLVAVSQAHYSNQDIVGSCSALDAILNLVSIHAGKSIDTGVARQLSADAEAIRAAMGCH